MLGKVILLFEIGRNLEHFEVLENGKYSELEGGLRSVTKRWWI